MKPYLTIKTVKGRKYIQISDINGYLIHIGPASKIETWSIAHQALRDAYEGFGLEELLSFKRIADEEGINLIAALDMLTRNSENWKVFREKQVEKRRVHYVARQLIAGFDIDDPQVLKGLIELETNIQSNEKTGRITGVSPEFIEMTVKIFKLYEKTEN